MIFNGGQTQYEEELLLDELLTDTRKLILYNDEVNTFDHVIQCLIKVCRHDPHQAEQCAMIVHFKGKAVVKEGENDELMGMCTSLCDMGLSATIEY